jgi:hypothetical protein
VPADALYYLSDIKLLLFFGTAVTGFDLGAYLLCKYYDPLWTYRYNMPARASYPTNGNADAQAKANGYETSLSKSLIVSFSTFESAPWIGCSSAVPGLSILLFSTRPMPRTRQHIQP